MDAPVACLGKKKILVMGLVWNMCRNNFGKENLCVLQVFLCVLISRPVCACTRALLRWNIAHTHMKDLAKERITGMLSLTDKW